MANDFSSWGSCKALYKFESGALTVDSQNSNTLTNSGASEDTTNYHEGSCSAKFTLGESDFLLIDDSDLISGFPLKSGDTSKQIFISFWVDKYKDRSGGWTWGTIFEKGNFTDAIDMSFSVGLAAASVDGDNLTSIALEIGNGYGSGANVEWWEVVTTLLPFEEGHSYHIAIIHDGVAKTCTVRVYDTYDSTAVTHTYAWLEETYVGTGALSIGNSSPYDSTYVAAASIDELVIGTTMSVSDADLIRQGAFVGPTAFNVAVSPLSIQSSITNSVLFEILIAATDWRKTKGYGPWDFRKQPTKLGYVNNPRFVEKDEATDRHFPCGYWPEVYSIPGWYQQVVAIDAIHKLICVSAIRQDNAQYRLMFYDYSQDKIIKSIDFATSGVLVHTYYGCTLVFDDADGNPLLLYVNYEDTDLYRYLYSYNSGMANNAVDTSVSTDYISQGVYLGGGKVLIANAKGSTSYCWLSQDYGYTWGAAVSIVANVPAILKYNGAGRVYAAYTVFSDTQPFRLRYSDDDGVTWADFSDIPTSPAGYSEVLLFDAVGDHLLVYYEVSHVAYFMYSSDAGVNWSACTLPIGNLTVESIYMSGSHAVASTYDSLTGNRYMLYSSDYGASWSVAINPSYLTAYNVSTVEKTTPIVFSSSGSVFVATYCGYAIAPGELAFQISYDYGVSWEQKSTRINSATLTSTINPIWRMPGEN